MRRFGSSPHTRGTLRFRQPHACRQRFIPAYAGNASGSALAVRISAVHPRIRGERAANRVGAATLAGSSPHTRGTLIIQLMKEEGRRFIPAYAGNASMFGGRISLTAVHPRIRGERQHQHKLLGGSDGSSPHTRGTHEGRYGGSARPRFIPAYAGNAPSAGPATGSASVHPRIRGERHTGWSCAEIMNGSSPHTRGTLEMYEIPVWEPRFIPAYAGNADPPSATPSACPVHPRIRGER